MRTICTTEEWGLLMTESIFIQKQVERNCHKPILLLSMWILLVLVGCANGTSTREPAKAALEASRKFKETVEQGLLPSYRDEERTRLIQNTINQRLINKKTLREVFKAGVPRTLCLPNIQYAEITARSQTSTSVLAEIFKAVKVPGDNWPELLDALKKDYEEDLNEITKTAKNRAERAANSAKVKCRNDLRTYHEAVYPLEAFGEEGIAFLDAAGTLWELAKFVLAAVETVAKEGAKEIISLRQAKALNNYFSNPRNVNSLKQDVVVLGEKITRKMDRERHQTVRAYIAAFAEFKENFAAELELDKLVRFSPCNTLIQRRDKKLTPGEKRYETVDGTGSDQARRDAAFQVCHAAMLSRLDSTIQGVLKTAAAYDHHFDKKPDQSGKKLIAAIEKLEKVATGKKKASPKDYIEIGLRWLALIQKAQETLDDEKLKMGIEERWNKFKKKLMG